MLTKSESFITAKIKGLVYKIFSKIENNNNADFYANGENQFLKSFLKEYSNGEITVFDVGANIGKYTEMVLKYCKEYNIRYQIHIFEPVAVSVEVLRKKFDNDAGVIVNAFGLSDSNTTAEIFYDKAGSTLASLYPRELSQANIYLDQKEIIQLQTLQNYTSEHNISSVDFMKIDVEGHEIAAFTGMGKFLDPANTKVIQFEYGGANIDSKTFLKNIYSILETRGYKICKVKKKHLEPRTYDVRMENFAYANYVALKA